MARMFLYIRKKAILNLDTTPLASTYCTGTSSPNLRAAERIRGLHGAHRGGGGGHSLVTREVRGEQEAAVVRVAAEAKPVPNKRSLHMRSGAKTCAQQTVATHAQGRKGACATTGDCSRHLECRTGG
jgi:hypothetical protein